MRVPGKNARPGPGASGRSVSDLAATGKPPAAACQKLVSPLRNIDIWLLRLEMATTALREPATWLSRSEHQRAARLRAPADRRAFIAAHALLRAILASYLGSHPGAVELRRSPGGKPRLGGRHKLFFNLSHAGQRAVCAVSRHWHVGVDIERNCCAVDHGRLAQRFLSATERDALGRLPARRQRRAFLGCWTRKEAVAKALGLGLALPFDRFDAGSSNGGPLRVIPRAGARPVAVHVAQLSIGRGWLGAVAALKPRRRK